ncbi:MAG TPA: ATP-binding protein, partial [Acidimicrobiales bacterium]|nr:ATP-binding protein [Acidimicrobiales bacterium]
NAAGGRIEISTGSSPGHATLIVSNTGPVVPPDQLEWLFQPFRRVGTERVGGADGHGLGLAITQAIAQAHGADVTVHGRPGGGLEIQVSFRSSQR